MNITSTAKSIIYKSNSKDNFIVLLTFSHSSLTESIRITSDNVITFSNNNIFYPYPFTVSLPSFSTERESNFTISIDNIDRKILSVITSVNNYVDVQIDLAARSNPDVIILSANHFVIDSVDANRHTLQLNCKLIDVTKEKLSRYSLTSTTFPLAFT